MTVEFAGPAFDDVTFAVSELPLLTVARLVVTAGPRAATDDRPPIRTESVDGMRWPAEGTGTDSALTIGVFRSQS